MADRYLKATGDWNNNATWSATDGGAAGASFPVAGDDVFITANGDGLTLTGNVASACASLISSGGSTATLAGASTLTVSGSVTLLATMTLTATSQFTITGTGTFTTGGLTLLGDLSVSGAGITVTLGDDYTSSGTSGIRVLDGALDTNGKTVNIHTIDTPTAGTKVITLGASIFTCRGNWDMGGDNVTVNAGTSTIIMVSTIATQTFTGGSQTYHRVELGGETQDKIIVGSNTFNPLAITTSGAQIIKFTDGTTQTVANFTRINDTTIKTLTGTSTGGWAVIKTGPGPVSLGYVVISYCTATPDNMWFFPSSVDGGNNRNLRYVIPYAGSGWWTARR